MQARGTWPAGEGDDNERFLADLRALRDTATLGFDELAARAHYPSDVLKEAENGPGLPGLPILAAYVRACDGDVLDWEERWRRLGFEAGADPGLPVRPAGASPAAVAGARAGVSVAPPDAYDPERIRAALRGSHMRAGQAARPDAGRQAARPGAEGGERGERGWGGGPSGGETARWDTGAPPDTGTGDTAAPGTNASWDGVATRRAGPGCEAAAASGSGAGWDTVATQPGTGWEAVATQGPGTGWDTTADQGGAVANGNHHAWHRDDAPSGTACTEPPDAAATADALRRDPFSSSWLDDSQPIPPVADTERRGQDQADADRAARENVDQTSPGWTDFWTPVKTAAAPAEVQRPPAPPSPADEPAAAEASWSVFTPSSPKIAAEPVGQGAAGPTIPMPAQAPQLPSAAVPAAELPAAPAPQLPSAAAPARPAAAPTPPTASRPDRYYPLRLLAVIVVAALIGSVLVILLQ